MFPLRFRLRTEKQYFLQTGSLYFFGCSIDREDVLELMETVKNSPNSLFGISFVRCKFDIRNHPDTLDLLRQFFENCPKLNKITLNSPTLSNENVCHMLRGCLSSVESLTFIWSFARAASLNRHVVFGQMHQLQNLVLKYGGLEYFSELDTTEEFAAVLPQLSRLEQLELHGWTLRSVKLKDLLNAIRLMPSLTMFGLHSIKGLTPQALTMLGELGRPHRENNDGLRDLSLVCCISLFQGSNEEQFDSFLENISVRSLKLENCGATRSMIRTLLQGVSAKEPTKLATLTALSLATTGFGLQEYGLLCELLPEINLLSLTIDQVAVPSEGTRETLVDALERNTSLEEFVFADRQSNRTDTPFDCRIMSVLNRNKRAHFVDRVLTQVSISSTHAPHILAKAIVRLQIAAPNGGWITDVQRLLTNRITVLTGRP